jgi:hypothetical protein
MCLTLNKHYGKENSMRQHLPIVDSAILLAFKSRSQGSILMELTQEILYKKVIDGRTIFEFRIH